MKRSFFKFNGNILVEIPNDNYFWGKMVGYSGLKMFKVYKGKIYEFDVGGSISSMAIEYISIINKPRGWED